MSENSKRILFRAISNTTITGAEAPAFIQMLDELNALLKESEDKPAEE